MITDDRWSVLIDKIKEGLCTPVLGAGASFPTLPRGETLAETLLAEAESKWGRFPLAERGNLAKVCQFITVNSKDNLFAKSKIKGILGGKQTDINNPDDVHRILADLELPIYLTTNYDDFMFSALKRKHAGARREAARWTTDLLRDIQSSFDDGYEPDKDNPVAFHVHGHLGELQTMVASEDDYLDFLVNASRELTSSPTGDSKRAFLPPRVRRALRQSTLLFVGYSLNDINFRVLLRGLVGSLSPSGRQMSMAVQYCDGAPGDLEKYMELYFQYTMQLDVFWCSASEFCVELRRRMQV